MSKTTKTTKKLGRPRITNEAERHISVGFSAPIRLRDDLDLMAQELGTTRSALVLKALDLYLDLT